jgi:hypothetical protein
MAETRPRLRTLHVEVTPDDIRNGAQADPRWCPIALALRRVGVEQPSVDGEEIFGYWGRRPFLVTTKDLDLPRPGQLWRFIEQFDHPDSYDTDEDREDLEPFAFDLEVVEEE